MADAGWMGVGYYLREDLLCVWCYNINIMTQHCPWSYCVHHENYIVMYGGIEGDRSEQMTRVWISNNFLKLTDYYGLHHCHTTSIISAYVTYFSSFSSTSANFYVGTMNIKTMPMDAITIVSLLLIQTKTTLLQCHGSTILQKSHGIDRASLNNSRFGVWRQKWWMAPKNLSSTINAKCHRPRIL